MTSTSTATTRSLYDHVTQRVNVHPYKLGERKRETNRRNAAVFIEMGYRVTDDHGFDLTIVARPDGQCEVQRGEDLLARLIAQVNAATERHARRCGSTGRPTWLADRVLTDYETGRVHDVVACTIPNCDNPAHFEDLAEEEKKGILKVQGYERKDSQL